jgi:DNA-binding transcriptional regulator YiaG
MHHAFDSVCPWDIVYCTVSHISHPRNLYLQGYAKRIVHRVNPAPKPGQRPAITAWTERANRSLAVDEVLTPELIRAARASCDMSQSVFAMWLGVSTPLVQKWEAGNRMPAGPALVLLRLVRRYRGFSFLGTATVLGMNGRDPESNAESNPVDMPFEPAPYVATVRIDTRAEENPALGAEPTPQSGKRSGCIINEVPEESIPTDSRAATQLGLFG